MLVESGAITSAQLDQAIDAQRKLKLPIGQILVKLQFTTDEVMRQELARQLRVPFVDLEQLMADRSLARLINRSYAKRHLLLPIARVGRTLTVAMDDPTSRAVIDDLQRLTGLTINVMTSSSRAIQRMFRRLYDEDAGEVALVGG